MVVDEDIDVVALIGKYEDQPVSAMYYTKYVVLCYVMLCYVIQGNNI